VKRSVVVRQALYRPYKDDRPTVDPALAAELRLGFAGEVLRLDTVLGRSVSQEWGYSSRTRPETDGSRSSPVQ
jgi:hypothetical protein